MVQSFWRMQDYYSGLLYKGKPEFRLVRTNIDLKCLQDLQWVVNNKKWEQVKVSRKCHKN